MAEPRIGEFELISRFFAPLAATDPAALGLKDDAAVLDFKGDERLVVTTDTLIAGVHFLADAPGRDAANKMARANLSDLASMGARPRAYTLNAALPRSFDVDWVADFTGELANEQRRFGWTLIGGDTVSTPGPLTLTLTAFGLVDGNAFLTRSGARAGDDVWVSGTIGDAFLGLGILQGTFARPSAADAETLIERYHRPTPRLELGRLLLGTATAAADVSDGLVADLGHIGEASGVDFTVDGDEIPLSAAAARLIGHGKFDVRDLWTAGDDYEIVFTAPAGVRDGIGDILRDSNVPVRRIGEVTGKGTGRVIVKDARGTDILIARRGHTHF